MYPAEQLLGAERLLADVSTETGKRCCIEIEKVDAHVSAPHGALSGINMK
jgi:hypothetical protein